jgi:hypothetical protein
VLLTGDAWLVVLEVIKMNLTGSMSRGIQEHRAPGYCFMVRQSDTALRLVSLTGQPSGTVGRI